MSHTPGPWTISSTDSTTVDIRCSREILVAEVGNTSLEDEANARLIAAAPELLAALQGLLNADAERNDCPGFASAGNWLRANEAARAAIAKINA